MTSRRHHTHTHAHSAPNHLRYLRVFSGASRCAFSRTDVVAPVVHVGAPCWRQSPALDLRIGRRQAMQNGLSGRLQQDPSSHIGADGVGGASVYSVCMCANATRLRLFGASFERGLVGRRSSIRWQRMPEPLACVRVDRLTKMGHRAEDMSMPIRYVLACAMRVRLSPAPTSSFTVVFVGMWETFIFAVRFRDLGNQHACQCSRASITCCRINFHLRFNTELFPLLFWADKQ